MADLGCCIIHQHLRSCVIDGQAALYYQMNRYVSFSFPNRHRITDFRKLLNWITGAWQFPVNKRLDEWVTEERLDTRKVQFPRRDVPSQAGGTGTPKKLGGGNSLSRPASPPGGPEMQLNGSAVLAAALQKKISRKRKGISLESEVMHLILLK